MGSRPRRRGQAHGGRLHGGRLRGDGDGSPHPRGQRVGVDSRFRLHGAGSGGTGMGPRIREDNGWGWIPASVVTGTGFAAGGRGWVPASARTTGGGGFPLSRFRPRITTGGGGGSPGCGGTGMGPRIREDNGWGWIPASVVTGGRLSAGRDGDGSPHPRGQRVGVDSRFRRHGGRLPAEGRGWVPASARTTGGGGFPLPSSLGAGSAGGRGWVSLPCW